MLDVHPVGHFGFLLAGVNRRGAHIQKGFESFSIRLGYQNLLFKFKSGV